MHEQAQPENVVELLSFEPLTLRFPAGVTQFQGAVVVELPPFTLKLIDLSMGTPDLAGWCVASRGKALRLNLTLATPASLGKMTEMITAIAPQLAQAHARMQEELNGRFLLQAEKRATERSAPPVRPTHRPVEGSAAPPERGPRT